MDKPTTLNEAQQQLALAFQDITGLAPRVTLVGRDQRGCPVVVVVYPGDEMVRSMQIEAFVIKHGDTIRHRSQRRHGDTILVYYIERKGGGGK